MIEEREKMNVSMAQTPMKADEYDVINLVFF